MNTSVQSIEERLRALELEAKRSELLAEYATKPVREFVQYDHFVQDAGDTAFGRWTTELRNGTPVRALIDPSVEPHVAALALREIADWIDRDGLIESPRLPAAVLGS